MRLELYIHGRHVRSIPVAGPLDAAEKLRCLKIAMETFPEIADTGMPYEIFLVTDPRPVEPQRQFLYDNDNE